MKKTEKKSFVSFYRTLLSLPVKTLSKMSLVPPSEGIQNQYPK